MTIDEILAALQAILDGAKNEDGSDRSLTDEEANRYEQLEGELTAVRRTAEVRSRHSAYLTPVRSDLHVHVAVKDEPDEQSRAFNTYLRTGDASVYAEYRAQTVGTDAAGGYAVPDTFQAKIIEKLLSFGGLENEAEKITTNTGEPLHWMTNDDTANTAEIVPETEAADTAGADLVFGTDVLGAFKYEATGTGNLPLKVSWELLQDANFDVESYIARKFAERIHRKMAVHFCTGAGTTEPQGLVTPQTAVDEIASNTDGPTYAELLGAEGGIDMAYQSNAKWLMHQTTWAKIRGRVDTTGRPLVQNQDVGIAGGVTKTLLGYPVVIDNGMPVIGDQSKSIVFGDLRESYIIRMVKDFQMVVLKELYAVNGFVGFLGWMRADGKVQNLNSYVVLGGQNTV